jgi:hypothetical protein
MPTEPGEHGRKFTGVESDPQPAGVADYARMIGACPYGPTGEHSWLPWWTAPSGQIAVTKCARCHQEERISVLPEPSHAH